MSTSTSPELNKDDPIIETRRNEEHDEDANPVEEAAGTTSSGGSSPRKQKKDNGDIYLEEEVELLKKIKNGCLSGNPIVAVFINGYSSLLIFLFHLISLESILSIALSVALTICKFL